MVANTSISILSRMMDRIGDDALSADAARFMLRMGMSPTDQSRVAELLEKLKSETITPDERYELEEFNRVNHLLTLFKSKARQALNKFPD